MPSVSTKVEIMASSEATEPIKKVLTVIDKKVRNLEKRKLRLDSYRQKQESGETLEKDQQVAVDRYGEVVTNLEFARDLQKQFQSINNDVEKLMKKQAKRGKSDKQLQEMKKIKDVLQLQGLLDNLGSPTVRSDFQTGKHGAIVLTEENVEQLDELYKLISPTHDANKDYLESLSEASEHIVSLLEAKEKPVVGSTYKDLKELLDLISGCGYFEKAKTAEESISKEEAVVGEEDFEVVESQDVPCHESDEVQSSIPKELQKEPPTRLVQTGHQCLEASGHSVQTQGIAAQADCFFTAPVPPQAVVVHHQQQQQQHTELATATSFSQHSRPFQEIVSSVQGNFNFLQESTIDLDAKREFLPHMDPAVVAAHPMLKSKQPHSQVPSSQKTDPSSHQQVFGASSYSKEPSAFGDHQSGDLTVSGHPVSLATTLDQMIYTSTNTAPTQDFAGSGFGPSSLTHSLQTDNLFSGAVSAGDASSGNMVPMIGKGVSDVSTISHIRFDIPPQLPMPPGRDQTGAQDSRQTDSEKKGYPMNPNATEFQSLIYSHHGSDDGDLNKSTDNGFQGGTFSNSNFTRQGSRERGGSNRSGFRGGRGGNRGSGGNMSNGYGGARGGRGNHQNYSRSDYQNEAGCQNYRSGRTGKFYEGSGYQNNRDSNRGEGVSRGGNRGGQRTGFTRGGSSPRAGSARGTNPQGFGRPNFNKPSQ